MMPTAQEPLAHRVGNVVAMAAVFQRLACAKFMHHRLSSASPVKLLPADLVEDVAARLPHSWADVMNGREFPSSDEEDEDFRYEQ